MLRRRRFMTGTRTKLWLFNHSTKTAAFSSFSLIELYQTQKPYEPLRPQIKQAFKGVLKSFSSHPKQLKQVHAVILTTGLSAKNSLLTSLIESFILLEDMCHARKVFDQMHKPRVFLWTTIIKGYVKAHVFTEAACVYRRMHNLGVRPDEFSYPYVIKACAELPESWAGFGSAVVAHTVKYGLEFVVMVRTELMIMCVRLGELGLADVLFETMVERDLVAWNAFIAACVQNGHAAKAVSLFSQMVAAGVKPDAVTFTSAFTACGQLGCLETGEEIYGFMRRNGIVCNTIVSNARLDMYVKCGSIEMAEKLFEGMSKKNVISWSTMIVGYAINGDGQRALDMFARMQKLGVRPNRVTYLGVLSACNHAGLVSEGKANFRRMVQSGDKNIQPKIEHYACIVDLLGRSGHLQEAYSFIRSMAIKPDAGVWGVFLGACAIHQNVELGQHAADLLLELSPEDRPYHRLMVNMYAAAGRWDFVKKVRRKMGKRGVKKIAAFSSVELDGKLHIFCNGSRLHPQSPRIYKKLEDLLRLVKSIGYIPNTTCLFYDVSVEENEATVSCHSEKLAISFSLINISPERPIRVVKNLLICDDCHSFCKFVSEATGREIIIRDKIRFHHFRNGGCSCNSF